MSLFDDVLSGSALSTRVRSVSTGGETTRISRFSDTCVGFRVLSVESFADYICKMVKPRFKGKSSINPSSSSSNPGELKLH